MGDSAPQIGVIMGSQSDWPTMAHAVQILEEFGIAHEVRIVSAHRTPDRLVEYAKSAAERGLKAIIAGAGGAARLQGPYLCPRRRERRGRGDRAPQPGRMGRRTAPRRLRRGVRRRHL